jgi:hypothetical protein
MKKITLLLLVFLSLTKGYSQKTSITWGESINDKDFYVYSELGIFKNETYVLMKSKSSKLATFKINKLDEKMNVASSTIINLEIDLKNGFLYEKVYFNEGKIFFFNQLADEKQKKLSLNVIICELNGSYSAPKKILDYSYGGKIYEEPTKIEFSPEKNTVLFSNSYDLNNNEIINLIAYSTDFDTPLWKRTIKKSDILEKVEIIEKTINNKGEVFLLQKITNNENKILYRIQYIKNGDVSIKEFDLDLQKLNINDIFLINTSKSISLAGFYNDNQILKDKNESYLQFGFFNYQYNLEKNVIENQKVYNLPSLNYKLGEKGLNEKLLAPYRLHSKQILDDGSIVIFGEQYKSFIIRTFKGGSYSNEYENFVYGDIAGLHIDKDGELKTVFKLHKLQHTLDDQGVASSFVSTFYNGNYYIFYVDDIKNDGLSDDDKKFKNYGPK